MHKGISETIQVKIFSFLILPQAFEVKKEKKAFDRDTKNDLRVFSTLYF
jgi:hypothetical protein